MADYLDAQLAIPEISARMVKVTSGEELDAAWAQNKHAAILAIEDARILAGDISRLDTLAARGVRYATLQWGGLTCIGGSHDTELGLTEFGKAVTHRCFELGIVPDISHASAQSADDILTLAEQVGRPVIATHSNAHAVWGHSRNLRDEHFKRLIALGGIVGLNLCAHHVKDCDRGGYARPEDMLPHIEHFLSLGGERHIAIGGDLDGASLPEGISTVSDVKLLASAMHQHGYSEDLIRNIFSGNAMNFIKHHLAT
jgi:membrane dipeptidase